METITEGEKQEFIQFKIGKGLEEQRELSKNTIKALGCDMDTMRKFFTDKEINRESMIDYRAWLETHYKTASVIRKIITANQYVEWKGLDAKIQNAKPVRNQTLENVMNKSDFKRMLRFADKLNRPRTKAIMQTLAGTGIRIGELKFFTVEALKQKHVIVTNKGSKRDIPLPKQVISILKKYCKNQNIKSGIIFRTKTGKPVTNSMLWTDLKHIAGQARVKKSKIHAHSFRHLFAINFLEQGGNVLDLQAILGHKSLETTSIYTRTTTRELSRKMSETSIL